MKQAKGNVNGIKIRYKYIRLIICLTNRVSHYLQIDCSSIYSIIGLLYYSINIACLTPLDSLNSFILRKTIT